MYFNTLSKTFIVLVFAGFAPLFVKGMRNPPGNFKLRYFFK